MAESPVVPGLKAKRDEIHRIVRECEAKIKSARADLAVINDALKIFGESVEPRRYERHVPLFEKGELFRPICDALRNAPEGLSTVQLATIVMQNKGMDVKDNKLFARAAHRVGLSLHHYKKNGRVVAGGFDGKARVWSLTKTKLCIYSLMDSTNLESPETHAIVVCVGWPSPPCSSGLSQRCHAT